VGETQNQPFQLSFNPCLKVDFQGSRITSDSGLLRCRAGWDKEMCCKSGAEHGKNCAVQMRVADPSVGARDESTFPHVRWRNDDKLFADFVVKKEIPTNTPRFAPGPTINQERI